MIRFLLTSPHRYTLDSVMQAPFGATVQSMNYDEVFRWRWLKQATYVFTDLDRLGYADMELAARLYVQLQDAGVRVLNNPALIKKRYSLLRALHEAGLNDFNAYPAEQASAPFRFPVFLRKIQGHKGPLSGLLHDHAQVAQAVESATSAGLPLENLILVEYAAEPLSNGIYRKLSAFKIGSEIIPHTSVHDTDWLVKQGRHGIAPEEMYREEREMIESNPYADHLKTVFAIANIDYGRVDFSIRQGRIQVYEINTNPHVFAPYQHSSALRMENLRLVWEKYLEGLQKIDCPIQGLIPFKKRDPKLRSLRGWKSFFTRTRPVE